MMRPSYKDMYLRQLAAHAESIRRIEQLEQQLSRYQGAVEVEGYIAGVPTDISTELYFASGWSKELGKFSNKRVRVLVYPQADKGAVALKEVE